MMHFVYVLTYRFELHWNLHVNGQANSFQAQGCFEYRCCHGLHHLRHGWNVASVHGVH
jgi:hypothetical protein